LQGNQELWNKLNMIERIFLWLILSWSAMHIFACQKRHACPAYHSSFILDEKKTTEFFAQFGEDSMPRSSLFVNKNKRGVIVRIKFQQKQKELNTVKMKMTYPPPADSVLLAGIDVQNLNDAEIDSILALAPNRRIHHNRDQTIYMMYIGQFNNWNDAERRQPQIVEDPTPVIKEKKKKWFWSRNKKQKEDHAEVEEDFTDEILPIDF
jgi:hypothetical protein